LEPLHFDVLVSIAFNIGVPALKGSTLLKRLRAKRFDDVPAQVMRWNKVDAKAVLSLTRRSRRRRAVSRGQVRRHAVDFH